MHFVVTQSSTSGPVTVLRYIYFLKEILVVSLTICKGKYAAKYSFQGPLIQWIASVRAAS